MRTKIVVCVVSLVIFCFIGTVQAQDPCQSYLDKYGVCVEKNALGREVDYDVCKGYDETDCEPNGCTWRAKGKCVLDMCLTDVIGTSGNITTQDYGVLKAEFGRSGCPSTPITPIAFVPPTPCFDSFDCVIAGFPNLCCCVDMFGIYTGWCMDPMACMTHPSGLLMCY